MKTLQLKTIATAIVATIATILVSCGQNEPEMPDDPKTTGNYLAVAHLTVNDSVMPFVESVQVRYTLPGDEEKIETLSFRPLQITDPETKILNSNNVNPAICQIAAFEKNFTKAGEVKMQLILNIDTTRACYAEKYDALILPLMAAGEPAGVDKYEALKMESDLFRQKGILADRLIEYLLREANSLSEMSFTLH